MADAELRRLALRDVRLVAMRAERLIPGIDVEVVFMDTDPGEITLHVGDEVAEDQYPVSVPIGHTRLGMARTILGSIKYQRKQSGSTASIEITAVDLAGSILRAGPGDSFSPCHKRSRRRTRKLESVQAERQDG
jgi:hypothetical protein